MKSTKLISVAVLMVALGLAAPLAIADDCPCPKPPTQTVVRVCVDQTRTLDQLISDGKYDWVNPDIRKYFSIELGNDAVLTDIVLLDFGMEMTSAQVLLKMDQLGLRPATLLELLSIDAQRPILQNGLPIVALGTVVEVHGYRSVAYLRRDGSVRGLGLDWFDGEWGVRYRFAAVRKPASR